MFAHHLHKHMYIPACAHTHTHTQIGKETVRCGNPSTWEAETSGSLSVGGQPSLHRIPGHSRLPSETLSKERERSITPIPTPTPCLSTKCQVCNKELWPFVLALPKITNLRTNATPGIHHPPLPITLCKTYIPKCIK